MVALIALYALLVIAAVAIIIDRWVASPMDRDLRQVLWKHMWFGELDLTLTYCHHEDEERRRHLAACCPPSANVHVHGGTHDQPHGDASCCPGPSPR